MTQKAAIVTTLKNTGPVLDSFIRYHLSAGFEHMFLFFDDPQDPAVELARRYSRVTVVLHDDKLREMWKQTRQYALLKDFFRFIDREVMARQMLNTEVAVGMALEKGMDWLLHIDSDEFFYLPDQTVSKHFTALAAKDIRRISYRNYEAIPERSDIDDYFAEVTLFKKNSPSVTRGNLSPRLNALISHIPQLPDTFFHFYKNGKSAARLCEGLLPNGVHDFMLPEELGTKLLIPNLPQNTDGGEGVRTWTSAHAVILHYACSGFESFWNKYVTLGHFDDKWFGQFEIGKRLPFHVEARNVVMGGNREAAREFYEKRFVINNRSDVNRLIEANVACRIDAPASMLAGQYVAA